jgi:hypothetical protein
VRGYPTLVVRAVLGGLRLMALGIIGECSRDSSVKQRPLYPRPALPAASAADRGDNGRHRARHAGEQWGSL